MSYDSKGFWLLVGASLNLFICAAGAGLLSFPYAVKNQGIIITILCTIAIAIVSLYTDLIYVAFGHKYCRRMRDGTLEEIIHITLGQRAATLALFTVVVGCFGSVIGFLILIGDVIIPLAEAACGDIHSSLCEFATSRAYMIITFTVVLVLPASSLSSFAHLAFGSAIAVGTLITVVASIVYAGFSNASQSEFHLPPNSYARPSWTVILGLPIAIFALGNHTQVIQIANEVFMRDPRAGEDIHKSVIFSMCACVTIYLLTGICGYLAFGNDTEGDVLLNFHIHDKIAAATRSLMAIHIALAVPVVVIPLRTICWHHLEPYFRQPYQVTDRNLRKQHVLVDQEEVTDNRIYSGSAPSPSINNMTISSASATMSTWMLIATTSAIILPCAGIAIACPQVAIVFGLLGASISTIQIYIFPGCMLVTESSSLEGHCNLESSELFDSNGSDVSSTMSAAIEPLLENSATPLRYIPRDKGTMKYHGFALIVFGGVISIAGTAMYIFSSIVEG